MKNDPGTQWNHSNDYAVFVASSSATNLNASEIVKQKKLKNKWQRKYKKLQARLTAVTTTHQEINRRLAAEVDHLKKVQTPELPAIFI